MNIEIFKSKNILYFLYTIYKILIFFVSTSHINSSNEMKILFILFGIVYSAYQVFWSYVMFSLEEIVISNNLKALALSVVVSEIIFVIIISLFSDLDFALYYFTMIILLKVNFSFIRNSGTKYPRLIYLVPLVSLMILEFNLVLKVYIAIMYLRNTLEIEMRFLNG